MCIGLQSIFFPVATALHGANVNVNVNALICIGITGEIPNALGALVSCEQKCLLSHMSVYTDQSTGLQVLFLRLYTYGYGYCLADA